MAEAFIVRRGGGGGSGGTLVVTSSGAGTVTVSNTVLGKSYSKSVTAGGSVTFKGLKTGEWTVTLSNGAQTTTRSVTINADYSVSVAYFAATISVTYPAHSTCTCSDGATTLIDTNDMSSPKTATFTVPYPGNWPITATATDGSGKSKSTTVSITADGQSESITLSYELVLFDHGTVSGYTWSDLNNNGTTLSLEVEDSTGYGSSASGGSVETIDMRDYATLKFHVVSSNTTGPYSGGVVLGTHGATVNFKNESNVVKAVNISSISSGTIYFSVSANSSAAGGTQSCKVVVDKIWLE